MEKKAMNLVRSVADGNLPAFAGILQAWLLADLSEGGDTTFPESRSKALLRVTGAADDPTLNDFARLVESEGAVRVALHDLLEDTSLADHEPLHAALTSATAQTAPPCSWLTLLLAAHAWQREYPLAQLDPASPPGEFSPAGQVVKATGHFLRQQVTRGVTERDRLARRLAYTGPPLAAGGSETAAATPMVPDPAVFRPPIPVNYREMNRPVQVDAREADGAEGEAAENAGIPGNNIRRGDPITITEADLAPRRAAPIKVDVPPATVPSPLPHSGVIMPNSSRSSRPSLSVQVKERLSRKAPALKSTKLRVIVQQFPDGPPIYGVQVRARCGRIKSHVAGTTNREGEFLCQIPVRESEGLTYDVEVTWPRDEGGDMEKKSITLNADRTEFRLPFYRRHTAGVG